MADRERRIQEIAYLLWEGEGRPDGQADRFWHMAVAAYEAEVEVIGGDKDETQADAEAAMADAAEVESGPANVPLEAEGAAPATKKPAAKAKPAAADEDKPNAAKPKAAGKAKADPPPAATKATETEPVVKSSAKPKAKKVKS